MIQVSNRKLLPENRGPEIRCNESGFTLAEVLVTVAICLFFGMAAFATNQRLLYTLRSQKETTAAIMVLQQRRESLRGMAFTDIATADTLKNVIKVPTGSEAPLSNLSETVTVSVDPTDAAYASPSPTPTVFLRDKNNATPSKISQNNNLPNYDLLRVDILLTWTGSNGRLRSRQSSEIFGHGNIGQ
jgi:prepilin-type N-terminal cleavage/methylation domain-containing protein